MQTIFLAVVLAELIAFCFCVTLAAIVRSLAARSRAAEREIQHQIELLDRYLMTPYELKQLRERVRLVEARNAELLGGDGT